MCTAIEGMTARRMGIKVCGVTLVSNMASGLSKDLLDEQEVIRAGQEASEYFIDLIKEFIKGL